MFSTGNLMSNSPNNGTREVFNQAGFFESYMNRNKAFLPQAPNDMSKSSVFGTFSSFFAFISAAAVVIFLFVSFFNRGFFSSSLLAPCCLLLFPAALWFSSSLMVF